MEKSIDSVWPTEGGDGKTCRVGHAFSFLGVQERKRLAKERRRQRKPFGKGFLWTLSKNRGAAATQTPEGFLFLVRFESKGCTIFGNALFLVCECARFWFVYNDFRAEQQTFGFFRRRANFLWKFLFAGTFDEVGRLRLTTAAPPARTFAEQKCLAAVRIQSSPLGNWIAGYRFKPVNSRNQQREYLQNPQAPSTSTA